MMMWMLALPNWIKAAAVGVALIGVLQVRHWWTVRGLHKEIAELTQDLEHEKAASAELRVALADLTTNQEKLKADIAKQNTAIASLTAQARVMESRATAASLRALRASEAAAAALREPDVVRLPPGQAAMNSWLSERFGL